MKPNTVAGPRPNCTALPHFLCLLDVQISLRGAATRVNRGRNLWRFSSNSKSWKMKFAANVYTSRRRSRVNPRNKEKKTTRQGQTAGPRVTHNAALKRYASVTR